MLPWVLDTAALEPSFYLLLQIAASNGIERAWLLRSSPGFLFELRDVFMLLARQTGCAECWPPTQGC